MSIERAIYSSLPLGIEKDDSGYQFFSYTPGFKALFEKDTSNVLRGLTTASYVVPEGNECFISGAEPETDFSSQRSEQYSVALPTTLSEKNNVEIISEFYHPYSFSYMPITVGDIKKCLFMFGKDMGMDWAGARPKTPYIYSLICDYSDVKKLPVLYCGSPSVCCNIPRSSFFPEEGSLKKPKLLDYTSTLDADSGIVDLDYSAGFCGISNIEVSSFIKSDDNADMLIMMLKSLMEYKDGNMRRRLIIADERRSILLWITAISQVFPLENAVQLSFSTYTYSPRDYDINGVFVPSFNHCFPDSRTAYKYEDSKDIYSVFDFSRSDGLPDTETDDDFFFTMVKCSFTINMTPLTEYKAYIANHTDYKGMGYDYAVGYNLYAMMTGKGVYNLSSALDFVKKYGKPTEKKNVLDKLLSDYDTICKNDSDIELVREYINFCCGEGFAQREAINERFEIKFNQMFFSDSPESSIESSVNVCEHIVGISKNDLGVALLTYYGMNKIADFANHTQSRYRLLFINRSICIYCENKKIDLSCNTREGNVIGIILSKFLCEDNVKTTIEIQNYLKENFEFLTSTASRIGLCDIVYEIACIKRLKSCEKTVLDAVYKIYKSSDKQKRTEIFAAFETAKYSTYFLNYIFGEINKETDTLKLIASLRDIFECGGRQVSDYIGESKELVFNSLKTNKTVTKSEKLNVYYSAFGFLRLIASCGYRPSREDTEYIFVNYLKAMVDMSSDLIPDPKYIDWLEELSNYTSEITGNGCDAVITAYRSLQKINNNLNNKKNSFGFGSSSAFAYDTVDITKLPEDFTARYLDAFSGLCGDLWADTEKIPPYRKMIISRDANSENIYQSIFYEMLKRALKKSRHNDRCAADAIEHAIICDYRIILKDVKEWLDECSVKKSVVDCLYKDIKIKVELKKAPKEKEDILDRIDTAALHRYAETVKLHYEENGSNGGGLGKFFDKIFKKD